jgi:hypothetical protein
LADESGHFFRALRAVVIPADYGGRDFRLALEGLFQGQPRAHRPLAQFGRVAGLILAADAAEELVDLVYDAINHVQVTPCQVRPQIIRRLMGPH